MNNKKPAPGANLDTGYVAFDGLNFNTTSNTESSFSDPLKQPAIDPLLGWHNLAKNARLNRKQKRAWKRRGK